MSPITWSQLMGTNLPAHSFSAAWARYVYEHEPKGCGVAPRAWRSHGIVRIGGIETRQRNATEIFSGA